MPVPRHGGWGRGAAIAAVLLPVALYLPALGFGFVFDDRPLLIENPVVRSPQGIAELFTADLDPRSRTSEAAATNYLRPLFLVVAAGLFRAFGDSPVGWHAAAIALHGLLGGLAFALLRREGVGVASALLASLLWSAHPSHAQSAAWVSGVQDLLLGCAAIVAFLAYRGSAERPRGEALPLLTLGLTYAVALLAKEPAVALLLFAAVEVSGGVRPGAASAGRRPRAELLVLASVTAAYFLYRIGVLGTLAHRFPTAPPLPEALASVPVALLAYGRDLLFPVNLFLLHPARPVASILAPRAVLSALGLLVVLSAAFWAVRRRPELRRPFLWCAVWIAPVLALWAVNPEWMVMDRYLLLPSLGIAWALALLLPVEAGRRPLRAAVWAGLLIAGTALSAFAMRPFENEERFWTAAVRADPGSSTAWTAWAKLRSEAGDTAAAKEALERAIALDPRAQLPRLRRALLALSGGNAATAVAELEELIVRNPGYLPAWRNLVVARAHAGDGAGARDTLAQALERFPADPMLWTQRAVLAREAGRRDEALSAIRRAIELDPGDPLLALREALLLAELGRREESGAAARRGLAVGRGADPQVRGELEKLAAP